MSDAPKKPLLSICIPTYNRASWLRATLAYIVPQVTASNGWAEVIVSDNCSNDDTKETVDEARKLWGEIRYNRNETNILGNPNMYKLVNELAEGKYAWVLGDDDFLTEGAVDAAVKVLQENPDLEYVYVNYRRFFVDAAPTGLIPPSTFEALHDTGHKDLNNYPVNKIADLVEGNEHCFTATYCSIFRRDHAIAAFLGSLKDSAFVTIESVIYHAIYVAEKLLDKPSYYIGYPYVVTSSSTSWQQFQIGYFAIYMLQLYDIFERCGVSKQILDKHRLSIIKVNYHHEFALKLVLDKGVKMKEQFSLPAYIKYLCKVPGGSDYARMEISRIINSAFNRFFWSFPPTRIILHRIYLYRMKNSIT